MHRELHRRAYNNALVERYKHLPEVKRIVRHRHLPAPVYKVCGTETEQHCVSQLTMMLGGQVAAYNDQQRGCQDQATDCQQRAGHGCGQGGTKAQNRQRSGMISILFCANTLLH